MRKRLTFIAALAVAAAGFAASSLPAAAHSADTRDIAAGVVRLDGAQETQAADPDGRGIFGYVAAGDKLCYILTARKIEPARAAHIHTGVRGQAGGIVVGLETPTDGLSFDCITAVSNDTPNTTAVLLQSELDAIIANPSGYYVNVHNDPFQAGAIRGQLR